MGHITVRGYKKGEDLIFEVLDDGVGFDENTKSQKAGKTAGLTGMGLKMSMSASSWNTGRIMG